MDRAKIPSYFYRVFLAFVLPVLTVFQGYAQIRKPIEIASFLSPKNASVFWVNHARFAGGVAPLGQVQFFVNSDDEIDANELALFITDTSKLANDSIDHDVLGLVWNNTSYQLYTQDYLLLPLMEYVERQGAIAYTISSFPLDSVYVSENKLVNLGGRTFVAQEFNEPKMTSFLNGVDFSCTTSLKRKDSVNHELLLENANKHFNIPLDSLTSSGGSYVNTDPDVRYQFYLEKNTLGKNVVNTGGLPLRYHYSYDATKRITYSRYISIFSYPGIDSCGKEEFQDQAIVFFQTAALFRQFYQDNRIEFERLLEELRELDN